MYSWFCFQERGNTSKLNKVDEILSVNLNALKHSCHFFFRENKILVEKNFVSGRKKFLVEERKSIS